jgi:hypothetical protein
MQPLRVIDGGRSTPRRAPRKEPASPDLAPRVFGLALLGIGGFIAAVWIFVL